MGITPIFVRGAFRSIPLGEGFISYKEK